MPCPLLAIVLLPCFQGNNYKHLKELKQIQCSVLPQGHNLDTLDMDQTGRKSGLTTGQYVISAKDFGGSKNCIQWYLKFKTQDVMMKAFEIETFGSIFCDVEATIGDPILGDSVTYRLVTHS